MSYKIAYKKTRLAPTPSGYLHIGNVLSFAITAALAKQYGAKILLRIDDVDRERTDKKYVQDIFDTLSFIGIPCDEGPWNIAEYENKYSQVHRMGLYRNALDALRAGGHVFACDCSRAQVAAINADSTYPGTCLHKGLALDAENVSWRLNTDANVTLRMKTFDGVADESLPASMAYFVVRKKDGFPAYQLTSVIDDMHFGIDLVVRGEDLRGSTLAQLYLSQLLGKQDFANVTFYHHPLLTNAQGEKLSKTAGDISVQYLRKEGKSAEDIYTIIGDMLGLHGRMESWEQLKTIVL